MNKPLRAAGYDDAVVGTDCYTGRIIYDVNKMVKIVMKRDSKTVDEANDYLADCVLYSFIDENAPIFLNKETAKEIDKRYEES
jgi:hypothetical protein